MAILPALLGACVAPPAPPAGGAAVNALARGLPEGELTLVVSEVAPGAGYDLRVVGALPHANVQVLAGTRPGASCPPFGTGACAGIAGAALVATVRADAEGRAQAHLVAPGWLPVGGPAYFQAAQIAGLTWYTSNLVERTVVASPAAPPGGNVLVLLADDLGVDKVGAYGVAADARTPNLDLLAAEGVRFRNAWATPWCSPTRSALQTGRHPRRTGIGHNLSAVGMPHELDPDQITLAELVEYAPALDYATAYVGKWHLATFDSPSGTLAPKIQGYDHFTGVMGNLDVWSGGEPADAGYYHWQKIGDDGQITTETRYATTVTADEAIDRITTLPEPWLVVVAFNAAHQPFDLPPADLHTDRTLHPYSPLPQKHLAIVEALDTEIGRLLGAIAPDVRDRTHVVFVGDNGTPPGALTVDLPQARAKGNVYDGGVRVPLIVTGPGAAVGATSDALVSVVDLFPTVAELAGVDLGALRQVLDREAPLAIDGRSLLPALADPTRPVHDTLWTEMFYPAGGPPYEDARYAIRDAGFKLLRDQGTGIEQFFTYLPGALDEGPDLLPCGLDPVQAEAYARLRAELDLRIAEDVFDAPPFAPPTEEPRHGSALDPTTACPAGAHTGDTGGPGGSGAGP